MKNIVDISIIIVNWNVELLLKECLNSIKKSVQNITYEIIIVDNASSDNSISMIEEMFTNVRLIKNKINKGFAKACNQGIMIAQGEYILLLNPDTIIRPGIEKIWLFAKSQINLGVVGCQLYNDKNKRMISYQSFPTMLRIFTYFTGVNEILKNEKVSKIMQRIYILFPSQAKHRQILKESSVVDSISGAFFLCKKELFVKIGLFDEKYFMYFEETDLCKRAIIYGYKNLYYSDYSIIHLEGQSAIKTKKSLEYYIKSLKYYFKKNRSFFSYNIAILIIELSIYIRINVLYIKSIYKMSNAFRARELYNVIKKCL